MRRRKEKEQWRSLVKKIESYVSQTDYYPSSPEKIRELLEIRPSQKRLFQEAISSLLREGTLRIEKGYLYPKAEELTALGVLRVHPRGFGFLQAENKERFPLDIFIPKHLIKGAVDGDYVEVIVSPIQTSEKGPEGKVGSVLKRGRSHLGGTVVEKLPDGGGILYAPLLGNNQKLQVVPSSERDLEIGDRVVAHVLEWGENQKEGRAEVSEFLGHISDPTCDIPAAIREFDLDGSFPKNVLQEVKAFGTQVTKTDLQGREDLRSLECFTIDPDTAKDFDDALSLTRDKKGKYHLGVHIADVSHYVKPGTSLDEEARRRCNSVYFPGFVIPMLPHELSSHLCSLKQDVNRLTVSILITLDAEGTVLNYRIARSVIRSAKRFTYKEAKAVLDGTKKSKHQETLFLMVDLCNRLKRKRYERGSIEFSMPDIQVHVNEKGVPEGIEVISYDITHQLVEEFMLKANELVATHLAKQGKPLTYRVHDIPSEENIKEFARIATTFGFSLSDTPTIEELQTLFEEARHSPYGQFLATAFIRSMKLAIYSTDNIGHYGLGLQYYTHFTSPIRRYIDLIVHRVLLNEIDSEEDLEAIALQCSEKERHAAKAENSVVQLKKIRLLHLLKKKDPEAIYEAVIISVKPFGFVFEILSLLMEGFIPISEIGDDYFVFEEAKRRLRGSHSHDVYQAGDRIEVHLKQVNLILQEARWTLVPKEEKKKKTSSRTSYKRKR